MADQNQKRPLHEVLSTRLDVAVFGVSRNLGTEREVEIILEVLLASRMPVWAAHQIAEYYTGLPNLLANAGWEDLAKSAEKVLADLRGREDEKKEQPVPAIAQ
ncbi:MAG: hypothetical protein Q7S49_01090 [bacterium]|nr:hypothetical protein [bacterium]